MPTFWSGLILASSSASNSGGLPVSGYGMGFGDRALAHAARRSRSVCRCWRSSCERCVRAFVTLCPSSTSRRRARGFSTRRVLIRHVFRNAVMPTVTVLAVSVGFLIGGTVVLEQSSRYRVSAHFCSSRRTARLPARRNPRVLAGSLVVLLNLGTDLLQAAVDPRVRPGAKSV